jgi:hypothetical protein
VRTRHGNVSKNEEYTEINTEIESETETERQTEIVVSEGGIDDQNLYDALNILAEDKTSEYDTAISYLTQLSEKGNPDAQYILGEMYLQGIGTDVDMDLAAEYIKQAYDNGNEKSFGIYGKLRFLGDGLEQDYEEAYTAFRSVLEDNVTINCALGIMNAYGMGVRIDYDVANDYLDKAIAEGGTVAQTVKTTISNLTYTRRSSEVSMPFSAKVISMTDYSSSDVEGLDKLVSDVCDKLQSTENYSTFIDELKAISKENPVIVSSTAIFGKDNWLFFQNEQDGDSYNDYVGNNEFSDKELAAIKDNLEKQEKKAKAAGAQFVLLIYPNKEVIYSEKMPSYIERESEVTRTDKLVDYLRENTDITIIYPKEEYMSLKEDYQLYYATDTHCNMIGTYVSLMGLMNEVYGKELSLDLSQFDIHSTSYSGDIGVMIGRDDRYSFDTVYFLAQRGVSIGDKVDESMSLIGDSFSEFLNIEAEYYFKKGVNHYMVGDYSYDYNKAMEAALSEETSDLIVWECAERCVERLK